jgi:predicted DNA repair protein MutK
MLGDFLLMKIVAYNTTWGRLLLVAVLFWPVAFVFYLFTQTIVGPLLVLGGILLMIYLFFQNLPESAQSTSNQQKQANTQSDQDQQPDTSRVVLGTATGICVSIVAFGILDTQTGVHSIPAAIIGFLIGMGIIAHFAESGDQSPNSRKQAEVSQQHTANRNYQKQASDDQTQ